MRGSGRGVSTILGMIAYLLVAVIFSAPAHAASNAFNLTTSPLPIELLTIPGKTVTTDLRVQNSGTAPVKIKVSLLKFKASGSNGQPELLPRQAGDTFFDWVSFSKTSFVANPNVWETVVMTVSPPSDAAFGYYYAVVFSQDTTGDVSTTTTTSKLTGAAATLVLLNVQATGEKKQVAVTSFSTDKRLYEYLPATFNITIRNTGNVHVVPQGNIYISRNHKQNVAVIDVNPNLGNTLPGSSRVFTVSWNDGFPVYDKKLDGSGQVVTGKDGKPVLQLNYDLSKTNKLRFGKYYAHLTLVYDDGTKDIPIEGEVSFWVVPWKLLPVVILAGIMVLVGLYSTSGSWIRWFKNKSGKKDLEKK